MARWLAPVLLLIFLLSVLAVLQFRWIGEISQAERERKQAGVGIAASLFARDFDTEITRAYITFQVNADLVGPGQEPDFKSTMREWRSATPFPDLVWQVLWIRVIDGSPQLSRFDAASGRLEPAAWPDPLRALKGRLDVELTGHHDREATYGIFSESGPVIVIPTTSAASASGPLNDLDMLVSGGATALTLDVEYIKRVVAPTLAERYFSVDGKLAYDITIAARDNPVDIIYSSNSAKPGPGAGDAIALKTILGIKPDAISEARPETRTEPAVGDKAGLNRRSRVTVRQFRSGVRVPTLFVTTADSDTWSLYVTGRDGPLQAAVSAVRLRNLALSFGILLILGLSVVLIYVSAQRARRLSTHQMKFVAGVSHQFRTPLTVISSAGQNLGHGVIKDDLQVARYGRLIESEARRLSELVEQVLRFAGLKLGSRSYQMRPFATRSLIERVIVAVRPEAEERGIQLRMDLAEELPDLFGDQAAIEIAVQNLLSNAVKYSNPRAIVTVQTQTSKGEGKRWVDIVVIDSGSGIEADDLSHIFEPFYRGRNVDLSRISGSGLGLALVKEIAQVHGGTIEVVSAPSEGSRFTLRLPLSGPVRRDEASSESTPKVAELEHGEANPACGR
jgi:signal transduction histidine kinase